jgi:hypothetical protein
MPQKCQIEKATPLGSREPIRTSDLAKNSTGKKETEKFMLSRFSCVGGVNFGPRRDWTKFFGPSGKPTSRNVTHGEFTGLSSAL